MSIIPLHGDEFKMKLVSSNNAVYLQKELSCYISLTFSKYVYSLIKLSGCSNRVPAGGHTSSPIAALISYTIEDIFGWKIKGRRRSITRLLRRWKIYLQSFEQQSKHILSQSVWKNLQDLNTVFDSRNLDSNLNNVSENGDENNYERSFSNISISLEFMNWYTHSFSANTQASI